MKIIPSFPNYCATKDGKIWSKCRVNSRNHRCGGRYLTQVKIPNGYWIVTLHIDGKQCNQYVHRLVLEAYCGSAPDGHKARHLNSNKDDNRLCNLEWATHQCNVNDAKELCRQRGENNSQSRLKEQDVIEIRKLLKSFSKEDIAKKYNVSKWTINNIKRNTRWAWLT